MSDLRDRPRLLLLGCGMRLYREYMLEVLCRRWDLWVMADEVPDWARVYASGVTTAAVHDSRDCIQALGRLPWDEIAGVMTYDEMAVEPAAAVAKSLGLPHNETEVARRCRDKRLMRARWGECGVASAASMAATHVEEGLGFAEALGYPVVLKPANLAGSVGVVRCDSPREFERAWAQVMGSSHPRFGTPTGLLVEEYLDGGEVSVESIVHEGTCYPVVITRKFLGAPPGFEEVGHIVSAADTEAHDEAVVGLAVAAHRALGIEHGATHAEVRLTSQGPRMVEIGARLAGDMIPLLAHVATGVDLTTAAAQVACGQMPDLQRSRQAAAGVRFFYPDTDVRVRGLGLRHGFAPAWLERIDWKAVPGDELRLPPRGFLGRLGFALVSGRDSQECLERLDAVEAALELDLEPLPLDPDVAHVVRGALSEQCVPNVDPATIGDGAGVGSNVLPVSSMGYLRALIRIEEDLGIEFAEDLLLEIHEPTVGDIVARAMGALGMAR